MSDRDTWEKPRGHGQHLTKEEIAFIRDSYAAGRRLKDVAFTLKCSSRVVCKYFSAFREEGVARPRIGHAAPPRTLSRDDINKL